MIVGNGLIASRFNNIIFASEKNKQEFLREENNINKKFIYFSLEDKDLNETP